MSRNRIELVATDVTMVAVQNQFLMSRVEGFVAWTSSQRSPVSLSQDWPCVVTKQI